MNTKLPAHLQSVVDGICAHGCQQVNHAIDQLQHEGVAESTESLSVQERTQVLAELQSIMEVYKQG